MRDASAGCAESANYFIMSTAITRFRAYLKYRKALMTALSVLDAVKDQDFAAATARRISAQDQLKDARRCFGRIEPPSGGIHVHADGLRTGDRPAAQ